VNSNTYVIEFDGRYWTGAFNTPATNVQYFQISPGVYLVTVFVNILTVPIIFLDITLSVKTTESVTAISSDVLSGVFGGETQTLAITCVLYVPPAPSPLYTPYFELTGANTLNIEHAGVTMLFVEASIP